MPTKKKPRHLDPVVLARSYGIRRHEASLLSLLLEKPSVLPEDLDRYEFGSAPKLVIWRLRERLKNRLPIQSKRFLGYWITPAHKQRALKFVMPRAAA
jgi:hypothetical protein